MTTLHGTRKSMSTILGLIWVLLLKQAACKIWMVTLQLMIGFIAAKKRAIDGAYKECLTFDELKKSALLFKELVKFDKVASQDQLVKKELKECLTKNNFITIVDDEFVWKSPMAKKYFTEQFGEKK